MVKILQDFYKLWVLRVFDIFCLGRWMSVEQHFIVFLELLAYIKSSLLNSFSDLHENKAKTSERLIGPSLLEVVDFYNVFFGKKIEPVEG